MSDKADPFEKYGEEPKERLIESLGMADEKIDALKASHAALVKALTSARSSMLTSGPFLHTDPGILEIDEVLATALTGETQ